MIYLNHRGVAMPLSAEEAGRVAGTYVGGETIQAAPGPSSLSGEGGGDVLIGNRFDNRHWITDPKDQVIEQADGGVDTEIGWTSIKLAANVENLQVNGAFNYAVGNALGNLIIVDNESHWIYGAGGDDVMVGGATSSSTFVVRAGEGSDVIYNWNGNSHLQLLGYGFGSADQLRAAMTQVGADVVLKLSANETLTFRAATPAAFADRQLLLPLDVSKLGAMTFADDFDSLQVYDPSTQTGQWNTTFGGNLKDPWAYTLPSNGERQVYTTPDFYGQGERALGFKALSTAGGVLTIKAEQIAQDDRDAAWGREYSSGMINTLGVFEQKYGYFEMRAELPTAVGTWPAFWMMPTPYAAQIEADIMEGLAATPNVDYRRAWGGAENLYDNAYAIDPSGYHTYGMLWTPTDVTFYYDGVAVLQAATPANWTVPMGMIINMAVGGWGGEPDEHAYPAQMHVDYVHAYALASGATVVETAEPVVPPATLRVDGGPTQGVVNTPVVFAIGGQAVTSAHIAVQDAKPATLPAGQTFIIWEDAGAVFGAASNGTTLASATALMAGDARVFTGAGTWLSDGKVVIGYMKPDAAGGQSAWAMVFDPATRTFTRHELGASTGDIDFVATAKGGFAASWDGPDGHVYGRGYDALVYDGEGWYGPTRQLTGDLTGRAATGELIATDAAGHQQLYDLINPPRPITAVVSLGPMAGVSHPEGDAGRTLYTFTLIRDWDQTERSTVAWSVRGEGASPADGADFDGGAAPSGVVTFEIDQTTAFIQIWVKGDKVFEDDESFLVTLSNPVGTKLGQATATGFILGDDAAPVTPPSIALTTLSVSHQEDDTGQITYSYGVTRSGSTAAAASVAWSVAGSGASPANAADFAGGVLPGGVLQFAIGETSKTIIVKVAGDAAVEPDESFTLTLGSATGAELGAATATGLIINDDAAPVTPQGQMLISEGYGVTLTGGAGPDILVAGQGPDVLTGGAGADGFVYKAAPWNAGRITDFAVGTDRLDLSALLAAGGAGTDPIADGRIILRGDGGDTQVLFDSDGPLMGNPWPITITTLTGVSASGLTWLQLTGTAAPLALPVPPPVVSLATDTVTHAEGASGATAYSYSVTRTGSTAAASSISWTVAGVGAAPAGPADFVGGALPSGTLTFAVGETRKTITVNVAGDGLVETTEGFSLTLSSPSGATLGASATAAGVITNDDNARTSGGAGVVITSGGYGVSLVGGAGDDTLIAGRGADVLTGSGGADRFVFDDAPWNAGKVTDFTPGNDTLDLRGLFAKTPYAGVDPLADHWLAFRPDGQGGVQVYLDMDGGGGEWPTLVTTLERLSPSQISASDWLFH